MNWNEYRSANKGSGMSQAEMSAGYQAQKVSASLSSSSSSASSSTRNNSGAAASSSSYNSTGASSISSRNLNNTFTTAGEDIYAYRSPPYGQRTGLNWNEYRSANKGSGMSQAEMSAGYQAQKVSTASSNYSSNSSRNLNSFFDAAEEEDVYPSSTSPPYGQRTGLNWNEYRSANKGSGMSQAEMSAGYQAQKQHVEMGYSSRSGVALGGQSNHNHQSKSDARRKAAEAAEARLKENKKSSTTQTPKPKAKEQPKTPQRLLSTSTKLVNSSTTNQQTKSPNSVLDQAAEEEEILSAEEYKPVSVRDKALQKQFTDYSNEIATYELLRNETNDENEKAAFSDTIKDLEKKCEEIMKSQKTSDEKEVLHNKARRKEFADCGDEIANFECIRRETDDEGEKAFCTKKIKELEKKYQKISGENVGLLRSKMRTIQRQLIHLDEIEQDIRRDKTQRGDASHRLGVQVAISLVVGTNHGGKPLSDDTIERIAATVTEQDNFVRAEHQRNMDYYFHGEKHVSDYLLGATTSEDLKSMSYVNQVNTQIVAKNVRKYLFPNKGNKLDSKLSGILSEKRLESIRSKLDEIDGIIEKTKRVSSSY